MTSFKKGFTLIEILVAISIIFLLTAFGLANYRQQKNMSNLIVGVQQIADDIQRSRNMAIVSEKYNMNGGGSLEVPCGYGIHFNLSDKDTYIIFAGKDDVGDDCQASNEVYDLGDGDKEVESISLPSNIEISNSENFDIFFEPPDPTTTLTPDPLTITLKIEGESDYKEITITTSGKIEY